MTKYVSLVSADVVQAIKKTKQNTKITLKTFCKYD